VNNTVKILIIIVIILVAVLGVAGGFILQGYLSNNKNPTVVNLTNTSNNTTSVSQTTQQKTQSTQSNIISPSQAKAIANNYAGSFGEEASSDSAGYYSGIGQYDGANGDPYYHVDLQWITPHNSDDPPTAEYVEIDAKTGAINPRD
jgi:uncharacterized membrane protein YkoI